MKIQGPYLARKVLFGDEMKHAPTLLRREGKKNLEKLLLLPLLEITTVASQQIFQGDV